MATSAVRFGALVTLEELVPSSPQFTQGASLRVTGKLQEYDIETAIASIVEGNASLKIDTQHLKVNLRIGSLYQFIGELLIDPSNQAILRARVGRNVDGMDLNLYHQSLQLLRDFQAEQMNSTTS
ncbi:CST complex subunit TEN1 [Coffea arabica]|uniref:CST complex subunit TEN1-like n=1 Tax=Coffea arabica TaxID=13443 RepID=A0A6P6WKH9_COFAR|nr:CST complex subunit TEN1-like [Coffea arabica]XP_027115975.1 CST complex subunit TEN1-like [Coffea arabica]XP_027115976.1 CST complex subunit TEN1-like [Coffea arabica]XP_027115977.1 CST complex subunit TEN1-like [Coffea arabica]XP_027115978.1 CST complex subunit TEN1-like [Coffea arabica]